MKNDIETTTAERRRALLADDIEAAIRAFWKKLEEPEEQKANCTEINFFDTITALGSVTGSVIQSIPESEHDAFLSVHQDTIEQWLENHKTVKHQVKMNPLSFGPLAEGGCIKCSSDYELRGTGQLCDTCEAFAGMREACGGALPEGHDVVIEETWHQILTNESSCDGGISIPALMRVVEQHKLQPIDGAFHITDEMAAEAKAIDQAGAAQ